MIRGNASVAVVFHCNLVIDSRCEDEAAAEVEISRDAHHKIAPVTAGISAVWSRVNGVVKDKLSVEIKGL